MLADGRQIVETARKEAINYRQQFDRPIPIKVLNDRISSFIHAYTLYSAVRPFGVSIILASYSPETGPQMYMIEPSGSSYVSSNSNGVDVLNVNEMKIIYFIQGYSGCATGKAKQAAKTEIEKLKLADMDIEELITQAGKM